MSSMLIILLLLSVSVVPLLLAIALMLTSLRRFALLFAPWAALPALFVSLLMPPGVTIKLPWLLLGSHLGFDETARIFLFFTALLWLVAGIYSTGYFSRHSSRSRFFIWFLLAMAGNLGLILAQDMVLFYTFFALMSFSSYGLVVFERTSDALRAGRVYIVLVVVGEVMLFAAFVLAALATGSIEFEDVRSTVARAELRDWIVGLVLLGFGIKAGVIGLHVWLPLAHPVAPTPASAVLSGAMISAGLLGWLRMLPLGEAVLSDWGGVMIVAGMVAIFYAVLVGLLQNNAKTVLAYSSVSTMGIMTVAVGLGLAEPSRWAFILVAILIYALQHGLAKGALFLGVGMVAKPPVSRWQHYLLIVGLLLPALSLAGAPLTSGMIAKHLLNVQLASATSPWGEWIQIMMPWSSVATSLLMVRFLTLVWPRYDVKSGTGLTPGIMWLSWLVLPVVVVLSPRFIPFSDLKDPWSIKVMVSALWPVALGGSLAAIVCWAFKHRRVQHRLSIPSGDILIIVENWLWPVLVSALSPCSVVLEKGHFLLLSGKHWWRSHAGLVSLLDAAENRFRQWAVAIILFLMLAMVFVFLASRNIL